MSCIKECLPFLQLLHTSTPKKRKNILKKANKKLIKTLLECVYNTLKGNIPLKTNEKLKLKKHKSLLRKLCSKSKRGLNYKKKIIVQSGGGFLTAILGPLIAAAVSHFMSR